MSTPSDSILRVRGLGKVYPNGFRALDGIDLDIERGEFLVVIGLSGAGKSTFIRCLNRLIEPTEGRIEFDGEDVTRVKGEALRDLRRRMALIFQHFNLVKRASVLTNALTGALNRQPTIPSLVGSWRKADREEAEANLALVGLEDRMHYRADALSGGQQQRVGIARALMQHPQVLLADEPVASLDPQTSHAVMETLKHLQTERGLTIVANLHFLSLAREYGTRVIALKAGRQIFEGPAQDITNERFIEIYGDEAREVELR